MLINGLLDIWQRATTITGQANGYATVDRWYLTSSTSCTFAQESTTVPTGCRYSQKVTVGASAASTAAYQAVETANVAPYAGQNVTFSGRFQSSATPAITLTVEYSTTVDYPLASGSWVAITATSGGSGTAGSSSFTTVSGVYAIPSTAKTLRLSFSSASMASGAILYYGGFQAELGVVVTSLVRNGTTLQGELASCQRYYFRQTGQNAISYFGMGSAYNATIVEYAIPLPVPLRVYPTAVEFSSGNITCTSAGLGYTSGTFTYQSNGSLTNVYLRYTHGSNVFTAGYAAFIGCSGTVGYIGYVAEL